MGLWYHETPHLAKIMLAAPCPVTSLGNLGAPPELGI